MVKRELDYSSDASSSPNSNKSTPKTSPAKNVKSEFAAGEAKPMSGKGKHLKLIYEAGTKALDKADAAEKVSGKCCQMELTF